MRQLALHTFRLSRLCLWFEGLICHACLVLARRSFSSESAMRVVHSHRRVLRCDRSLSSESAIIVLWIWFGMAIPWYRFLNERVTFSIAFVCITGTKLPTYPLTPAHLALARAGHVPIEASGLTTPRIRPNRRTTSYREAVVGAAPVRVAVVAELGPALGTLRPIFFLWRRRTSTSYADAAPQVLFGRY